MKNTPKQEIIGWLQRSILSFRSMKHEVKKIIPISEILVRTSRLFQERKKLLIDLGENSFQESIENKLNNEKSSLIINRLCEIKNRLLEYEQNLRQIKESKPSDIVINKSKLKNSDDDQIDDIEED